MLRIYSYANDLEYFNALKKNTPNHTQSVDGKAHLRHANERTSSHLDFVSFSYSSYIIFAIAIFSSFRKDRRHIIRRLH